MSELDTFWKFCWDSAITSKKLRVRRQASTTNPVVLEADEKIPYGATILSVPYLACLNCQTLRGGLLPRAVPPIAATLRLLTRRGRRDAVTAHSLWLTAFTACYAKAMVDGETNLLLAPLFTRAVRPPLASPLDSPPSERPPHLRGLSDAELSAAAAGTTGDLRALRTLLRYRCRRLGLGARAAPSLTELRVAHNCTMQRSVLLPLNCAVSAPGELSELLDSDPALPLLPTIVPVLELVSSADAATANCAIFTCIQSEFLSANTHRRFGLETTPLQNRCVVLCASKNIAPGDLLAIDYT